VLYMCSVPAYAEPYHDVIPGKFPISHPSDCIAYYACGFACAAPHPGMVKRLATQRQSLSRTHFPPHSHTSRTHFPPRSHTSDNRRALLAFRNVRNSARVSRDNHRHIGMPNIWIFNRNLVPTLKIAPWFPALSCANEPARSLAW